MVQIGPWKFGTAPGVLSEHQAYVSWYGHWSKCGQCSRHETMPCDVGYRLHQAWRAAYAREQQEARRVA